MPSRWEAAAVLEWLKLHFPEALMISVVEDDLTQLTWRFRGAGEMMAEFLDRVSHITYGRSRAESIQDGICVSCGRDARETFKMDSKEYEEYLISGLCTTCQVKVFGPS